MLIKPIKTNIFKEGSNLVSFIKKHVPRLSEDSVLVITSKIVALAERRTAVIKDAQTKEKLIRRESTHVVQTKYVWLTLKDGMLMPSAGIDESNANGKLILLPRNSFTAAQRIRRALRRIYGVKRLGILITDSRTLPLRAGVTGVALGYAGFQGLRDYRGKPDIFGRPFHFSRTNVADGLAAAAVLVMGEGSERLPLALITKAPVVFCSRVSPKELNIPLEDDMYQPLFSGWLKR
jgi:coenzyme F420-0:L-glutamate ligase